MGALKIESTFTNSINNAAISLEEASKDATVKRRFDVILDAAEVTFAALGAKGATMREIAERAGVAQGLIHYHFATKEKLFERMVARRSDHINTARAEMLAALLSEAEHPALYDVVEALFRPTIEAGITLANDGSAFARILVTMANSAEPRAQELAEKYYDPIARKFIAALMLAEPELSHEDAVWSYMFAIGVGMNMMARTGRSLRLSDGICDDGNAELMLTKIVPFICGGIQALVNK